MELQICDAQASCHITIQSILSWHSSGSFPRGLTSWLSSRQPAPFFRVCCHSTCWLFSASAKMPISPGLSKPISFCAHVSFPPLARGRCLPDFPDHTSFGLTQRYFFKLASVCETNEVPHACQTLQIASS